MRETVTIAALLLTICSAGAQNGFKYEIPYPARLEKSDSVKIVVTGDVMMHSRQLEYDCGPFLSELRPLLEDADFAIANMEFSLGGEPYSGYPAFSAPDSYASYVQSLGGRFPHCKQPHTRPGPQRSGAHAWSLRPAGSDALRKREGQ